MLLVEMSRKLSALNLQQVVQDNRSFAVGIVLCSIVLYIARYITSPYRKLPPGPRGYPFIGNVLEFQEKSWLKFAEWRKLYGDIIYLDAAGQPTIILNSQKVAADLLDRRAGIYSDRPRFIVACEIMTDGLLTVFTRYGEVWRRMRKAANEALHKGAVGNYHEAQIKEAILLACRGLADPAQWDKHLNHAATSMALSTVYDHPMVASQKDQIVEAINSFSNRVAAAAYPGAHLVEFFPWMRYIPSSLAKWKRVAIEGHKKDSAMFEDLYNTVKAGVEKGDDRPSISATLVRKAEKYQLSNRESAWLAGTLYNGGSDTTSATMAWWTTAILLYPETQERAQAELDAVVGRTRLPTFADLPHLPYIRAMVKEANRWGNVGPLGVGHKTTEDDWYEGMFIPKGTVCMPNVWLLNHDPEIFGEDAAHFNPARHLDANGDIAPGQPDTKDEGHFSYGFGRRACIGRHVANNSLFIDIAIVLWAAKFERKKDASGNLLPLDLDGHLDSGLVLRPMPSNCNITPRFPEAHALLAQECELRGL